MVSIWGKFMYETEKFACANIIDVFIYKCTVISKVTLKI